MDSHVKISFRNYWYGGFWQTLAPFQTCHCKWVTKKSTLDVNPYPEIGIVDWGVHYEPLSTSTLWHFYCSPINIFVLWPLGYEWNENNKVSNRFICFVRNRMWIIGTMGRIEGICYYYSADLLFSPSPWNSVTSVLCNLMQEMFQTTK